MIVSRLLSAASVIAAGGYTQTPNAEPLPHPETASVEQLIQVANRGDPHAQLQLAGYYRDREGSQNDMTEAAWWYRKAAERGLPEAQYQIGVMYLEGVGVTENSDQALRWIATAAEQKHQQAREIYDYILTHDEPLAC